eukprot:TRINITY_DN4124_c0_g2_i1.p2 TRINITY_DN4124_c0_g2~~TRINITY_DN4124_c0_g2_i1.p2  ORF type:complete len:232 (-),score=56.54 TRINITY_DN4124_c0_g2_i1:39-734(-)
MPPNRHIKDNFFPVKTMYGTGEGFKGSGIEDDEDDGHLDDFDSFNLDNKLNFSHLKEKSKPSSGPKTIKIGSLLAEGQPSAAFPPTEVKPGRVNPFKTLQTPSGWKRETEKGSNSRSGIREEYPQPQSGYREERKRISADKLGAMKQSEVVEELNELRDAKRNVASAKNYGHRRDLAGVGGRLGPLPETNGSAKQKKFTLTDNYFKLSSANAKSVPFNSSLGKDFLNLFAN